MKLRNKRTGEIVEWFNNTDGIFPDSLAKLNEEWEDYEEPETYYYISDLGNIESLTNDHGQNLPEEIWHKAIKRRKEIGNHFETEEETAKAVDKLKAWERLKDKGFRFVDFSEGRIEFELGKEYSEFTYDGYDEGCEFYINGDVQEDLELLFRR